MSGHTPGPWLVDGPRYMQIDGRAHCVINPERFPAAFVPAWDRPEDGEVDDTEEAKANARLIAAAPDLLDAGEKSKAIANRVYQMGDAECRRALSEIFDILAPAIAKAKESCATIRQGRGK